MADYSMKGELKYIGEVRQLKSQSGFDFVKRIIVIEEVNTQYPSSAAFELSGDNAQYFNGVLGQTCEVFFSARVSQFNGRWYNDFRAWRYVLN